MQYKASRVPPKPWCLAYRSKATVAVLRDGALLVADRGEKSGDYLYCAYPWQIRPETGAVVEARVKVESGCCSITVSDGVHEERVEIHDDGILLRHTRQRFAMDASDGYHLYRVAARGEHIAVYVDGKRSIGGRDKFTQDAHQGRNVLQFGAANSPSLCESYWSFLRFCRQAPTGDL